MYENIEKFREAIRSTNMEPPKIIEPGKIHRFPGVGKSSKNTAGWCRYFSDGLGGCFGDYSSDLFEYWLPEKHKQFTQAERTAIKIQIEDTKTQIKNETIQKQADAKTTAAEIWDCAKPAPDDHPYLTKKQVKSYGLRLYQGKLKIANMSCDGAIIIPIRQGKDLVSLQFINSSGEKRYLPGGEKAGCYFSIGKPEKNSIIGIAEGYATAATSYASTNYPIAVAFDSGNLSKVAKRIQTLFPNNKLLIIGDDDHTNPKNPGLIKAKQAAVETKAFLVTPEFGTNRPAWATDLNDMMQIMGIDAVKECIHKVIQIVQPDPFPIRSSPQQFPIDALGPILGNAATALAYHVQTTLGMAAQAIIATASLVAQAHIDVQIGTIGKRPVSLFFLTVAESGDRKSSLDRSVLAPIRAYESERLEIMRNEEKKYKAELEAWEIKRKLISQKGKNLDQRILADQLLELEMNKPDRPIRSNITFSEPTPEGIWRHYMEGLPNAGLFSAEGISFFGSHGMDKDSKGRTISMLSTLWDGDPLTRTRGSEAESGVLLDRRLASHLMIQPVIATTVFADPILQGQGFLARFLICNEQSIAGTRFLANRDPSKNVSNDPAINLYTNRIEELLRKPIMINESGGLILKTSEIKDEAFDRWCALHDGIEEQLDKNGQYNVIKVYAAKGAENAARIASVLAFFDGYEHPSTEHIERAAKLISYYLESILSITNNSQEDAEILIAKELFDWLKQNNYLKLSSNDFKNLPNRYRKAEKIRKYLSILVEMGHIKILGVGKKNHPNLWGINS